jgi:capsular polysaccharide export protein
MPRFRQYLLRTSQLTGSFYSAADADRLLREIVDRMLRAEDVYATSAARSRHQSNTLERYVKPTLSC